MSNSPIIGAPELVANQAIPETTVNEQLRFVEQGARFFSVLSQAVGPPPGSPADGDAYLVPADATGAWAGKDGKIAFRMSTGWLYITPKAGSATYVVDEAVTLQYDGPDFSSTYVIVADVLISVQLVRYCLTPLPAVAITSVEVPSVFDATPSTRSSRFVWLRTMATPSTPATRSTASPSATRVAVERAVSALAPTRTGLPLTAAS